MGDMNNIMHVCEKTGPGPVNPRAISEFCCLVKDCGFFDLGFKGPAYTWTNKRFDSFPTYERLDRFLCNAEWCANFPRTNVFHLPMLKSDHSPILAILSSNRGKISRTFKNWWLLNDDFQDIASASWQKSQTRPFHLKTFYLAKDLVKWQRNKPKNSDILRAIEDQLLQLQSKPPGQQNPFTQKLLIAQHENILAKEEAFHRQRYKHNWCAFGDRNTKFFHQAIIKRAKRNTITHFLNPDGSYATAQSQLANAANNYFVNLFASDNNCRSQENSWASHFYHMEQIEDNSFTNSTPTMEEIQRIVSNMRSNAAPGPDGFNAGFYKAAWNWVGKDVATVVTDFYENNIFHNEINRTHIALIPKIPSPDTPKDYRPISLCNVIYKIIAKTLAKRIKIHLPHIIHPAQAAFMQGRHIASNIILAQEIIHSFNLKSWKQKAFMLKVDLAKAFDRIEWHFIDTAMQRLGFKDRFIQLVYTCISSTTMAVIINGEPRPEFNPRRGIRQGCPLSPYLFIIAINELALCLQNNSARNNIQGITLGPNCPRIHAFLFANDLIICGQANAAEASKIHAILQNFCAVSGQTPNLSKSSILFSRNVDNQSKKEVKKIFPVNDLLPNMIYLGHPLIFNHSDRCKAYDFIINKFRAKLNKLRSNKLNHAGRLTYINSVLASIPIYYMSTILFSKNFIDKITAIVRKFWWAGVQDENASTSFHFRSWKDICRPKDEGGLGIRDLFTKASF